MGWFGAVWGASEQETGCAAVHHAVHPSNHAWLLFTPTCARICACSVKESGVQGEGGEGGGLRGGGVRVGDEGPHKQAAFVSCPNVPPRLHSCPPQLRLRPNQEACSYHRKVIF